MSNRSVNDILQATFKILSYEKARKHAPRSPLNDMGANLTAVTGGTACALGLVSLWPQ